ncbi:unnamed protein product [Tilletia caries]|nr:unnamed protein product [Tilletia caries]CAD6968879.1 unnamed protein product [Tilletia controversa]
MPPRSLIHAVQDHYLSSIRSVETASRWKILVTDSFSHTLLFSVLKTDQILQENVTSIENIEHKRAPQPSFEAAYILCPTSKNYDGVADDFVIELVYEHELPIFGSRTTRFNATGVSSALSSIKAAGELKSVDTHLNLSTRGASYGLPDRSTFAFALLQFFPVPGRNSEVSRPCRTPRGITRDTFAQGMPRVVGRAPYGARKHRRPRQTVDGSTVGKPISVLFVKLKLCRFPDVNSPKTPLTSPNLPKVKGDAKAGTQSPTKGEGNSTGSSTSGKKGSSGR